MPVEPPQNGEYMAAAYAVTVVILLGYWAMLWSRGKRVSGKGEQRKR